MVFASYISLRSIKFGTFTKGPAYLKSLKVNFARKLATGLMQIRGINTNGKLTNPHQFCYRCLYNYVPLFREKLKI